MLFLVGVQRALGADPISLEDFKKIADPAVRYKIIDEAPPEQKKALIRISAHLRILQESGGNEDAARNYQEDLVAEKRGFESLTDIVSVYSNLWVQYIGGQPREVETPLNHKKEAAMMRLLIIRKLVFNLARSPQALALEKQIAKLDGKYRLRVGEGASKAPTPVTKKELAKATAEMDRLVERLKRLPALSPQDAQKEYDNYPQ